MDRLDSLAAENRALRQLLQTLTSDAAHNEAAMQRFQERELSLLGASDLPALVERLTAGLRTSFGLESVLLVLFDPHRVLAELFEALGVRCACIPHLHIEHDVHKALARYPDPHRPWLGPWIRSWPTCTTSALPNLMGLAGCVRGAAAAVASPHGEFRHEEVERP